ncbi:MAG: alpha-2-macroglobulin [Alphaproteobacteria bacterium]
MKHLSTIIGAAAVAAIAGAALYWQSAQMPARDTSLSETARETVTAGADRAVQERGTVVDAAMDSGAAPGPRGAGEAVADRFAFSRLRVDTNGDDPEACLVFTKELDREGTVRYGDYLSITPDITPVLRVQGPLLCLGGLSFSETYSVTVRAGMPSQSGDRTPFDETVRVELKDRPAAVTFGDGLILPREGTDGIPITTVNVETLKIRVLRIGDRILSQLRAGMIGRQNLREWRAREIERENAALVWSGEMDVAGERNATTRTIFPLRTVLPKDRRGAYWVLAEDASGPETGDAERASSSQWVLDSDLALTSFSGEDGLRVFVRSLATARPLRGVEVHLVARNNDILGTARTDSEGQVTFDPGLSRGEGGLHPVMVMAYADGDFMILDLRRPAFDLSDRGVDGRPAVSETDAFVYLDRGIYRPGETVQVVSLLRDRDAMAIADVPLTIVMRRPDGIEYRRLTVKDQASGAVHVPVTLSRSAPRGLWSVQVYLDPERAAVGSARFDVQDFVPERLEVSLETDAAVLRPGDAVSVDVTARYLYDAPGKDLGGEASMRIIRDPRPFPDHADYDFGRVDEPFSPTLETLSMARTDAQGKTLAEGTIQDFPGVSHPLRADITVSVFEPGGRTTREQIALPIRPRAVNLGIRPTFRNRVAQTDKPAAFQLVALDPLGEPIAAEAVSWTLIREVVNYQWYQSGNDWRYERIVRDRPVEAGNIDLAAASPARLEVEGLASGGYRLEIEDKASGARSSMRFWSGWYGGGSDQRPDRVTVLADKSSYSAGDTARVTIRPPMAGKALVTIAGSRVFETRLIDLPADGLTMDVPVKGSWGTGAYVLVNAYRPLDGAGSMAPVRAIGLAHLALDQSARTLEVRFDLPERLTPQTEIEIPVSVARREGQDGLKNAHVTLAAVDTGILNLTDFEPPAPERHYFGKRRLALEIRDDYGRLIRGARGSVGALRSGGDAMADAGGLQVVPTRTVALFSGIVSLAPDGSAVIPVTVPDFVGELTLMAVAFSPEAVGHGSVKVAVRRDVVADLTLPRFLAPGDQASATLQINNVDGPAGSYAADISTGRALRRPAAVPAAELAMGEERRLPVTLSATAPGVTEIGLKLVGPDDFRIDRSWPIEVRAPRLPRTTIRTGVLEPGTDLDYGADVLDGFYPSTADFSLALSSVPAVDVPGLLKALDRYPYGCLEQTTSRAFPLLYFNDLAAESGLAEDGDLQTRLQNAVDKVLDLQRPNGAFGMWTSAGGEANLWLSVFALDFLTAAKATDLVVPTDAVHRGHAWLANLVEANWRDAEARAYAAYVLAKVGKVRISDVRYLFDSQRGDLKSAIGLGFLGGALDALGDRARGRMAFTEAVASLTAADPDTYESEAYGSLMRDVEAVSALIAESRRFEMLPPLMAKRETFQDRLQYATTQDRVWMLLNAHYLSEAKAAASITVAVDGTRAVQDPARITLTPDADELRRGVSVRNTGEEDLWYVATAQGIPNDPLDPAAEGLRLRKRILSLDAKPVDLATLRQSERYIVLIAGRMEDYGFHEMALVDLLPAGFEIETVLDPSVRSDKAYRWLPKLSYTRMASARDDRFVASFTIGSRYRRSRRDDEKRPPLPVFAFAYVVRAITPGTFALPAVRMEDMYAPRVFARTAEGSLTILPAGSGGRSEARDGGE